VNKVGNEKNVSFQPYLLFFISLLIEQSNDNFKVPMLTDINYVYESEKIESPLLSESDIISIFILLTKNLNIEGMCTQCTLYSSSVLFHCSFYLYNVNMHKGMYF